MKVNSNVKIKPLDYSSSLNWLIKEDDGDKEVDVFYLYPTAVPLDCEDMVGEINDIVKENAMIGYKKGARCFSSYCNVFVPLYHQMSFRSTVGIKEYKELIKIVDRSVVKTDIYI